MKKVMVTGATGFIGARLCNALAERGYTVHALYRSKNKTICLKNSNIHLFKGDITDPESIEVAMKGCHYVFHLAAYAQVWAKNKETFYDINYSATREIFILAHKLHIEKVVFTSTAGVIGPSENNRQVNEQTVRKLEFFSEYERTKSLAEAMASEFVESGLHIVTVNPTRVFGPGELSVSNSVTKMIWNYYRGKFRFLPGNGKSIGNYVFVDDVVEGHIQALKHGKPGQRYILGGGNVSYIEFFNQLASITGKKYRMFKLPLGLMIVIAYIMLYTSKINGVEPLITPGWVKKFNHHWNVSSQKAINEIHYNPISLQQGLTKTMVWLKSNITS